MVIFKKNLKSVEETKEPLEDVISRAGQSPYENKDKSINILLRLPTSMHEKIKELRKNKSYISRNHWILEAINAKIEQEKSLS